MDAYQTFMMLQAISLDFLGVPGSEVASKTANLIEKHGFPEGKRLGAGVVDGRSVWSDGETPSALVAALQAKVWSQDFTFPCSLANVPVPSVGQPSHCQCHHAS